MEAIFNRGHHFSSIHPTKIGGGPKMLYNSQAGSVGSKTCQCQDFLSRPLFGLFQAA